jgi:hypothetical protein
MRLSSSALGLVILSLGCAHSSQVASEPETEDGLLRVYRPIEPAAAAQPATPVVATAAPEASAPMATAEPLTASTPVAPAVEPAAPVEPAVAPAAEIAESVPGPAEELELGSLSVRVKGARRCAVRLDHQAMGKAPVLADNVEPGKKVVTVKCAKRPAVSRVVYVEPGEDEKLVLSRRDLARGKKQRGSRRN